MPITQLDPCTAFISIDLQIGLASMPALHPMPEIVQRAAHLARSFREHQLPVVLVTVSGGAPGRTDLKRPARALPPGWDSLVPELAAAPTDHCITKQRPGAFIGTQLDVILRQAGVTQIVLVGVSTSNGVEATARSAYDLGYHVTFVLDAITDSSADMHQHSVDKVFPKLGESGSTAAVLELLAAR